MKFANLFLRKDLSQMAQEKTETAENSEAQNGKKTSVLKASVFLAASICLAIIAIKEYKPFAQLESISFDEIAKKELRTSIDSVSALFALTDNLIDTLEKALLALPKDYQTELPRELRMQIEEASVQGIFFYIESKDIEKRKLHATIQNQAQTQQRGRRDAWQPDSGWAGYLFRGARRFSGIENRRNIRTYYEWFKKADSLGIKDRWQGPIFDDNAKDRIIYRIIQVDTEEENGFAIIAHSTSWLYTFMQKIGISRYGSPYILDSAGRFVVSATDNTRRLSRWPNKAQFKIPEMPFTLGMAIYSGDSQESSPYQSTMRRIYFRVLAFATLSILLLLFGMKTLLRRLSTPIYILLPLCLLSAIIVAIISYNRYPSFHSGRASTVTEYEKAPYNENDKKILKENGLEFKWNPALIVDQKGVDFFVNRYQTRSDSLYGSQARILPTGVVMSNVLFVEPNVILANGIVWQKFLKTGEQYPRQISRKYLYDTYRNKGIDFFGGYNEGSYGGNFELLDSIETTMDGHKAILMRWGFVVEMEYIPAYGLYPFGVYNMPFIVNGKNRDDNTILVPDITAYSSMFPTDKPGIDDRLEIMGWDILQTSYSYSFNRNQSNMGNINSQSKAPSIRLNMLISSRFVDILVSKLLSVMVIITLLFVLICIREKDNILDTVLGCSGLFFALVLDHVNLRGDIKSTDVMYLEFIYLASYGFLLLTILSSVYLKKTSRESFKKLNSLMIYYFWTAFFGVMAVATLLRFY